MLNKPSNSTYKNNQGSAYSAPDPWAEDLPMRSKSTHPSWQFPLKPDHEISAAPAAEGILGPQNNPNALKLSSHPDSDATTVLLEEEMKVDATQEKSLWNHIRDAFALLWWSKWENTV